MWRIGLLFVAIAYVCGEYYLTQDDQQEFREIIEQNSITLVCADDQIVRVLLRHKLALEVLRACVT